MSEKWRKSPRDDDQAEQGSSYDESIDEGEPRDEFRRDGKSWAIYLQEAGENAKDQTEVWKTGLESLLIFAGLFASVITSFLVEARQRLRLSDEEALLADIRSALLNEPMKPHEHLPTTDQLWVNGLWFTSLLVTLFSAIIGVLARSWLVNHLPPRVRQEAPDAYRRWMLDERAKRWKLQKVITGIPLLVQLAFFLFSLGLGIQTYHDSKTLGLVVLALIAFGTSTYSVVTILPLLLPPESCPFQTPLTVILLDLQAFCVRFSKRKGSWIPKTSPEAVSAILTKILYERLIKSRKPEHIDAAVAELNHRPLHPLRRRFFSSSDAPAVSIQRIQQCMSTRFEDPIHRDQTISSHLRLLSQLAAPTLDSPGMDQTLACTLLRKCLVPGGILERWDYFTESLRPLAYSIMVPLCLELELDLDQNWSSGAPWESIAHHIQPSYRMGVVKSACHGIVEGKENLQKVSSFLIIHLIARSFMLAPSTQWGAFRNANSVHDLCDRYLRRVFETIENMWRDSRSNFLEIRCDPAVPSSTRERSFTLPGPESQDRFLRGHTLHNLVWVLTANDQPTRLQGIKILTALAKQAQCKKEEMERLLSILFETMLNEAYKPSTIPECVSAVISLRNTEYEECIFTIFSQRLSAALETDDIVPKYDTLQALRFIKTLASRLKHEGSTLDLVLESMIPFVISVTLAKIIPVGTAYDEWAINPLLMHFAGVDRVRRKIDETLVSELRRSFETHAIMLHQDEKKLPVGIQHWCTAVSILLTSEYSANEVADGQNCLINYDVLHRAIGRHTATLTKLAFSPDTKYREQRISILLVLCEAWFPGYHLKSWKGNTVPAEETRNDIYHQIQGVIEGISAADGGDIANAISVVEFLFKRTRAIKEYHAPESAEPPGAFPTHNLGTISLMSLRYFFKFGKQDAVLKFLRRSSDAGYLDGFRAEITEMLPRGVQELCEGFDRAALVDLLGSLLQQGWPDALSLLIDIALHDSTHNGRTLACRQLVTLCNCDFIPGNLADAIVSTIYLKLPQLDEPVLDEELCVRWMPLFLLLSSNVLMRSFCCKQLEHMLKGTRDSKRLSIVPSDADEATVESGYKDLLEFLCNHSSTQVRQAALEAWTNASKGCVNPPGIAQKLANLAFADSVAQIRLFCLEQLSVLASSNNWSPFVAGFIKESQSRADSVEDLSWRKLWIILVKNSAYHGDFEDGVIWLVQKATKEEDEGIRISAIDALASLATSRDICHTILTKTPLPRYDITPQALWGQTSAIQIAWTQMLGTLSSNGNWKEGQEALVKFAINYDPEVRSAAYNSLSRFALLPNGGESVYDMLAAAVDRQLGETWFPQLDDFQKKDDGVPLLLRLHYAKVAETFIFSLVNRSLTREPQSTSQTHDFLADALGSIVSHGYSEHRLTILNNVVRLLPASTPSGAESAAGLLSGGCYLIETFRPGTLSKSAGKLASLLQSHSRHVRSASLEILTLFHSEVDLPCINGVTPYPGFAASVIRPAMPNLLLMVLEDEIQAHQVQATELLCALCSSELDNELEILSPRSLQRLLDILRMPPPLSLSAARLIARLASDASVRRSICSWTITQITAQRSAAPCVEQFEGVVALLCELVTNSQLDAKEPTEYLLLLLATSLALKGTIETEHYRPLLMTALWLNYHGKSILIEGGEVHPRLRTAFEYTIFGKHSTSAETAAWLALEHYLDAAPKLHATT